MDDKELNRKILFIVMDDKLDELNKLFIKGVPIDIKGDLDRSILHLAAQFGSMKIIKHLIEQKFDVNIKDKYGYTPLHLTALNENSEAIQYLIKKGAKVDEAPSYIDKMTPLLYSIDNGWFLENIKTLIDNGANIKAKDANGRTPLHIAVKSGYIEIVEYLIEKGADVDTLNNRGLSALDVAKEYDNVDDIIDLLSKHKKALDEKNKLDDHAERTLFRLEA